ncbi:MAG: CRISPR-associated endonuclease Cas1 [Pseudomonadota bacterium]
MHQSRNIIENASNSEWAIQSESWIAELVKLQKQRKLRERNPNPLILSGHGNSMRIDKGTLLIKEGFTHYPQKQSIHRFFPGDLDLPPVIMLLDGSGSLSFEVLSWLSEQSVSLIRIKWNGEIAIVCSGGGYAADQGKVDWQRETRSDPKKRLAFSSDLITRKLQNSIATLQKHLPQSDYRQKAIERATRGIDELSAKPIDIEFVRSIEAQCASAYFKSWNLLKPQWKANSKFLIPDHWKGYRARTSVHQSKPVNFNATDPVNAMLNYAYAVKQSQLQISSIGEGYDPTIGVMHHGRRNKPAYIFDLLEPERPNVDAVILEFVQSRKLSPADFILRKDGVCRLSPGLAKIIAAMI